VPPVGKYFKVVDTTHVCCEFPFLKGQQAHYHKLTQVEYLDVLKMLKDIPDAA
jgi:hypothetical protein